MMTNNKSSSGMTVVGVVVVVAVLVLMIQTSTTSAARPNGVLPPALSTVAQVAGTSSRPCRPLAASTGKVQVAPATVRTDKVAHVAAPTSDVDRPAPAFKTDKVQIAAATSDAVLPKAVGPPGLPELVHLAPGPAELARIAASKDVADHPEALDVVGGP